MAILGVVDVWNPGEARSKQRPYGLTTFRAGPPRIRAPRHIEHWMIPEERHDLVEVVTVEGVNERLESFHGHDRRSVHCVCPPGGGSARDHTATVPMTNALDWALSSLPRSIVRDRREGLTKFGARYDAKFWVDAVQVSAHRAMRQEQPVRDLPIGQPRGRQLSDLQLLWRECLPHCSAESARLLTRSTQLGTSPVRPRLKP